MRNYAQEEKYRAEAVVGTKFLRIRSHDHGRSRDWSEVHVVRATKTQIELSNGATLVRKSGKVVGEHRESYASSRTYYIGEDAAYKAELEGERALGKAKRAVQDAIAAINRLRVPALIDECRAMEADLRALLAKYEPKEEKEGGAE